MPAHGQPLFLAEAVESVLGQTTRELRLIVLDDSRDDAIGDALRAFRDDARLEHRRAEPMTATQAMTTLMQAASAPYFALLHDDDRWGPRFLERRLSFLEEHPECALVFSGHVDINERGEVTARAPAPYPEGVVPRERIVPDLLRRSVIDVMHSVVVRREALEAAGARLDAAFPRLFDWELWLRLVLRFPVGCVDETDAEYRAHDAQMSGLPGQAEDFAALFEHGDALARELAPDLRLSESERRERRAGLRLSLALDRLQADDAPAARAALRAALRTQPRAAALDRRFPAILAGLTAGRRGRAALARLRATLYRRGHQRRRRAH